MPRVLGRFACLEHERTTERVEHSFLFRKERRRDSDIFASDQALEFVSPSSFLYTNRMTAVVMSSRYCMPSFSHSSEAFIMICSHAPSRQSLLLPPPPPPKEYLSQMLCHSCWIDAIQWLPPQTGFAVAGTTSRLRQWWG